MWLRTITVFLIIMASYFGFLTLQNVTTTMTHFVCVSQFTQIVSQCGVASISLSTKMVIHIVEFTYETRENYAASSSRSSERSHSVFSKFYNSNDSALKIVVCA